MPVAQLQESGLVLGGSSAVLEQRTVFPISPNLGEYDM